MRYEIVTVQELIEASFGPFTRDSGTGWNLMPTISAVQPAMSEEDLMELIADEGDDHGEHW